MRLRGASGALRGAVFGCGSTRVPNVDHGAKARRQFRDSDAALKGRSSTVAVCVSEAETPQPLPGCSWPPRDSNRT